MHSVLGDNSNILLAEGLGGLLNYSCGLDSIEGGNSIIIFKNMPCHCFNFYFLCILIHHLFRFFCCFVVRFEQKEKDIAHHIIKNEYFTSVHALYCKGVHALLFYI